MVQNGAHLRVSLSRLIFLLLNYATIQGVATKEDRQNRPRIQSANCPEARTEVGEEYGH